VPASDAAIAFDDAPLIEARQARVHAQARRAEASGFRPRRGPHDACDNYLRDVMLDACFGGFVMVMRRGRYEKVVRH